MYSVLKKRVIADWSDEDVTPSELL